MSISSGTSNDSQCWVSSIDPLAYLLPNTFTLFGFSLIFTMSVSDED